MIVSSRDFDPFDVAYNWGKRQDNARAHSPKGRPPIVHMISAALLLPGSPQAGTAGLRFLNTLG